jgi:hypothetical protein
VQCVFLRLVLQGVSLRAVPRVLAVLSRAMGWGLPIPHWTTGRLWLLRLGHAALTADLDRADDWAWLIDHSVQIGPEKCLVILGIRLRDLPAPGQCLRQADVRLIALVPRTSWTRAEVDDQLERACARTGVPRVIVNDRGVDLSGGVAFFRARHRSTVEISDAKHQAACLLKRRLRKNPRWLEFQRRVGQTRCAIQQTELAFLVPPSPKPKARFMNLAPTLRWAENVLAVLRQPPPVVQAQVTPERLAEKLGWVQDFAPDLAEWSEWQGLCNRAVAFVERQGIFRGAARQVRAELRPHRVHPSSKCLAGELAGFVAQQAKRTRLGERVPGSTEVLESCFGRFKQLEKQHAQGGFTSLILGFGALLADTTAAAVRETMRRSKTKAILDWCKKHLGSTFLSRRRLAFKKAQQKPDE